MKNKKTLKIGAYSVALSAIVLAVVIAVNLFVSQLPSTFLRPDLSPEGLTTIGEETEKILKNVKDEVQIFYIVTEGKEDSKVKGLVDRYADATDKIKITQVDPISQPNFTKEYTSQTLSDNSLIFVTEKRTTTVDGNELYKYLLNVDGYADTYLSYEEYYSIAQQYYYSTGETPEATSYFFGENEITGAIDFVTGEKIPVIYNLTGHGETDISGTGFGKLLTDENIELKSLSLASGETSKVPDDAEAVLVHTPQTDIGENEKDALISYIDRGGNVMLLTYCEYVKPEDIPNLTAVCSHMGLEAVPDLLADSDESRYYQYPFYLIPAITGNGFTSEMDNTDLYVFMPESHGIEITGENADVEAYSLLQTSENAYVLTEETAKDSTNAEKNMYSLGYQSVQPNGGSLIWFASPHILNDNYVNYGNAYIFLSALRTVCEKTTSVSIIGKPMDSAFLEVTAADMTTWLTVLAAVVVVVVVTGTIVFIRRRRK